MRHTSRHTRPGTHHPGTSQRNTRRPAASSLRARGLVVPLATSLVLASTLTMTLASSGCVARRTVGQNPHEQLGTGGNSSADRGLVTDLIVRALPRVLSLHPLPAEFGDGPILVQFPAGTTPLQRQSIEQRLANTGIDVQAAVRGDGPRVYHVGRIWRRGGEAKVDVYRPVFELGMDNGWYPMQAITVELRGGGLERWTVTGHRTWAVGALEPPAWIEPPPVDAPEDDRAWRDNQTDQWDDQTGQSDQRDQWDSTQSQPNAQPNAQSGAETSSSPAASTGVSTGRWINESPPPEAGWEPDWEQN